MIAALYCRVSTDSQRERQTIETQKRILADYAQHQGWEVLDWYIDDGVTGTSIEERPEFTRLLREAEEGRFDVVAVVCRRKHWISPTGVVKWFAKLNLDEAFSRHDEIQS